MKGFSSSLPPFQDFAWRYDDQGETRIASFGFAPERRFRCLITMFPSVAAVSDMPVW